MAMLTAAMIRDYLIVVGCRIIGEAADPESLSPDAEPQLAARLMDDLATPASTLLVLVGHVPHVQRLAELLIGAASEATAFEGGGGLILEMRDRRWSVATRVDQSQWWERAA